MSAERVRVSAERVSAERVSAERVSAETEFHKSNTPRAPSGPERIFLLDPPTHRVSV